MISERQGLDGYARAVEAGRCLAPWPGATELAIWGRDVRSFLQRLCSADLRALEPGQGCPAFFLDARGRALAFVHIYLLPDRIVISSSAGQAANILDHLSRYRIREDVHCEDLTANKRHFRLFGRGAATLLATWAEGTPGQQADSQSPPFHADRAACGDHGAIPWAGFPVTVRCLRRGKFDAFALVCESDRAEAFRDWAAEHGAVLAPPEVWDAARIELGLPEYARDITADCLGPEVSPDPRAISTTKGCYLGQETVARLASHGHLNRRLRGLILNGGEHSRGSVERPQNTTI